MPVVRCESKDPPVIVLDDARCSCCRRGRWPGCRRRYRWCHDGRANGRCRRHQRSQSDLDCLRCAPPVGSAR
jgi:hypothetical protein